MNTLTTGPRARLPRVLLLLVALFLPLISNAVYYNPGPSVVVNTSVPINYYGTYGMTAGTYVPIAVQAPGSSTWTTIAYAVTTHHGGLSAHTTYTFTSTGVWGIRVGYDAREVLVTSN